MERSRKRYHLQEMLLGKYSKRNNHNILDPGWTSKEQVRIFVTIENDISPEGWRNSSHQ